MVKDKLKKQSRRKKIKSKAGLRFLFARKKGNNKSKRLTNLEKSGKIKVKRGFGTRVLKSINEKLGAKKRQQKLLVGRKDFIKASRKEFGNTKDVRLLDIFARKKQKEIKKETKFLLGEKRKVLKNLEKVESR